MHNPVLRSLHIGSIALLASVAPALAATAAESLSATITIRAGESGTPVSPLLYGIFYEDINYAADGGLYAELVQNRSFDYYALPRGGTNLSPTTGWQKVERGGRTCELKTEIFAPLHPRNPHYAAITLKGETGEAGIANTGYGAGIPVIAGATYDVSLWARTQRGPIGALRVALETAGGEVLASADLQAPGAAWAKQEAVLVAKAGAASARLAVTTASSGILNLDMVSLFPRDTFKGRRNGLRKDLAQAIADLHPRVMRFPGGCLVHGTGLDNAYYWKETVGPIEQRRPKFNRWGYHQTFGLGYFEFMQYCEDIGAEPLPILPAGVSCGFSRPFEVGTEEQIRAMIQDAIDLVEFANGPADTRWGRVRADMGHPTPFNLKYVGLGNEEHDTTSFRSIFPRFVKALRDAHPEIKIVGTSGLGPSIPLFDLMEATGVDISDEHYYEKPEWFIENRNRFDTVKRGPTKIFVGEYASKGNKQFNAVAEAVYLAGIERNADHVVMAAYAPLLARYDYTQWMQANMIWFDHANVVKTPNYWVQQLFATHLGDQYLPNTVDFAPGSAAGDIAPVLAVSPTRVAKDGTIHLKVANPMGVPVHAAITIAGIPGLMPQAELVTLAAAKDAQNDLANPERVAPATSTIAVGPAFTLPVPAMSVQVLTLRAAPAR